MSLYRSSRKTVIPVVVYQGKSKLYRRPLRFSAYLEDVPAHVRKEVGRFAWILSVCS